MILFADLASDSQSVDLEHDSKSPEKKVSTYTVHW